MISQFKTNLILLFFKESKGSYIMYDLLRLLSISQGLLEHRIDKLIEKELLFVDERANYQITETGLNFLRENKFDRINLFELINEIYNEDYNFDVSSNGELLDIYIPKNFKNVIYSKEELDGLF